MDRKDFYGFRRMNAVQFMVVCALLGSLTLPFTGIIARLFLILFSVGFGVALREYIGASR